MNGAGWNTRLSIVLTTIGLLALAVGCEGSLSEVSADDYGDAWPLTVDHAHLHCVGSRDAPVVWMGADRHNYALNGFSRAYLNRHRPNLNLWNVSEIQIKARSIMPPIEQAQQLCEEKTPDRPGAGGS